MSIEADFTHVVANGRTVGADVHEAADAAVLLLCNISGEQSATGVRIPSLLLLARQHWLRLVRRFFATCGRLPLVVQTTFPAILATFARTFG